MNSIKLVLKQLSVAANRVLGIHLLSILLLLVPLSSFSQDWEALIYKGGRYQNEKNNDSAIACYERALILAVKEGPAKHAVTLGRIADFYYQTGDYEKALEYFITEKNLEKSVYGRQHPNYAITLNNLSVVYQFLGRYHEAEQTLKEALELKKFLYGTNDTAYAKTLHNFGKLFQTMGNYEEAEKNYIQSLDIKKSQLGESHPINAGTLLNLGILHYSLSNYDQAEKEILASYDIYQKNFGENYYLTNLAKIQLALVYNAQQKKNESNRLTENLNLDINNGAAADYPVMLYDYALLKWSQAKYDECEKLLLKAKTAIETQLGKTNSYYSSCLNCLGILYWVQGKYELANKYLTQVVTLRELFFGENHPEYALALFNIAGLQFEMKNYVEADRNYKVALEASYKLLENYFPFLSESEKERYFEMLGERYEMFNNYIIFRYEANPGLLSDMYNFHLATESILLNNLVKIRKKIIESGDEILLQTYDKWKKSREELAKYYNLSKSELKASDSNIDSLQNLINSTEKELSLKTKKFGVDFKNRPYIWQDVQKKLKDGEAAVEIIRFNQFKNGKPVNTLYSALIIRKDTKDNPEFLILDDKNGLEENYIKAYNNSVRNKIEDKDSYREFWAKLDDRLKGINVVYFSPAGVYNKINLNTIKYPDGNYLINQKDIRLIISTSDILTPEVQQNSKLEKVCLIGNPKFKLQKEAYKTLKFIKNKSEITKELANNKLSGLPGTEVEINSIDSIAKAHNIITTKYSGETATKANLLEVKNSNIIHIATHGFFLRDAEIKDKAFGIERTSKNSLFRSGLFLAGAENSLNSLDYMNHSADNGILSAYEVMNMDLENSRLVVLSACETGLGEIKNGEGVYGLRRAFQVAGTQSLILSLWKVNDDITQKLMTAFYLELFNGATIDKAFEKAQLEIKAQYPAPYYWGAFVKVGI